MLRGSQSSRALALATFVGLLVGAHTGCASSAGRVACAAGEEARCTCATGGASVQRCRADGVFEACACPDGGPSALDAPCLDGQTTRCECDATLASGLRTCRAGSWSACACEPGPGATCVPLPEATVGTAPREPTGEDLPLDGTAGFVRAVLPLADAYVVVRNSRIERIERGTHVVSAMSETGSVRGAALRDATLFVVWSDSIATYDTGLRIVSRVATSESPLACTFMACGLWACATGADDVVLDARSATVRSRHSDWHHAPTTLVDHAAFLLDDWYFDFDARGVVTGVRGYDNRPYDRPTGVLAVAGRAPHRTALTATRGHDLEGCIAGRETCLEPRFVVGDVMTVVGSSASVAVGLTSTALVAIDLATGRSTATPLDGQLGDVEPSAAYLITHDPWTGQAIVALRPCASCGSVLRFLDVPPVGEP